MTFSTPTVNQPHIHGSVLHTRVHQRLITAPLRVPIRDILNFQLKWLLLIPNFWAPGPPLTLSTTPLDPASRAIAGVLCITLPTRGAHQAVSSQFTQFGEITAFCRGTHNSGGWDVLARQSPVCGFNASHPATQPCEDGLSRTKAKDRVDRL